MLHPQKTRVAATSRAAAEALGRLQLLARPAGSFDASRYFRADDRLGFFNAGTGAVRRLARTIADEHAATWPIEDAAAFAERLMTDRHLEAKLLGIEVLGRYRRGFTRGMLDTWKRWLADGLAANWATTDSICGVLTGPLLLSEPALARKMPAWGRHRNMWVRRAAAVSLIPSLRRGLQLDVGYQVAELLHPDSEDLIQKAVGWMLREGGKADAARLERYLRGKGPLVPRTTLRYAIERFPPVERKRLLTDTRRPQLPNS